MMRKHISNTGFFCLMTASLMTLILFIASILQELFNILQDCVVFKDEYVIVIIVVIALGLILTTIGEVVIKD